MYKCSGKLEEHSAQPMSPYLTRLMQHCRLLPVILLVSPIPRKWKLGSMNGDWCNASLCVVSRSSVI